MQLLGIALEQHTFCETVCKIYEEESQQQCWDFFLHKVHGKSFQQFMDECAQEKPHGTSGIRKEDCAKLAAANVKKFQNMTFGQAQKF